MFKDEITNIIDGKFYYDMLSDLDDKSINTYCYHFIIVKYKENNKILEIKIDNFKDLDKIKDKDIIVKYYIEKLHYYNYYDNILYDDGEPIHICNLGYFQINGEFPINKEIKKILDKLFNEYDNNYKNIKFELNDKEFLSLNK